MIRRERDNARIHTKRYENDISSVEELGGLYALCGGALWLWSDLVDGLCDLPCGASDVESHRGEGC